MYIYVYVYNNIYNGQETDIETGWQIGRLWRKRDRQSSRETKALGQRHTRRKRSWTMHRAIGRSIRRWKRDCQGESQSLKCCLRCCTDPAGWWSCLPERQADRKKDKTKEVWITWSWPEKTEMFRRSVKINICSVQCRSPKINIMHRKLIACHDFRDRGTGKRAEKGGKVNDTGGIEE